MVSYPKPTKAQCNFPKTSNYLIQKGAITQRYARSSKTLVINPRLRTKQSIKQANEQTNIKMRFSTLISNYEQSRAGPSPHLHFFFSSDSMLYLFLMSCVHRVTSRRARIDTKSRLVGSWPRALISHAKVKHAARFH